MKSNDSRSCSQDPSQPRPSAPDQQSAHVALYVSIESIISVQLWLPSKLERVDLFVVVVRHLQASPLETALDVESLVGVTAIKDSLVAANFVCDEVESLDQPETQLLALLILCDGDVLDVANLAEVMNAGSGECVSTEDQQQNKGTSPSAATCWSQLGRTCYEVSGKVWWGCDTATGLTYNFLSAISAPVPTTLPASSMTST